MGAKAGVGVAEDELAVSVNGVECETSYWDSGEALESISRPGYFGNAESCAMRSRFSLAAAYSGSMSSALA